MTKEERTKILLLLSQYYPNAKQLRDKNRVAAWELVLARFPYDDVKNAVVEYAASHKFFPDVSDICGGIKTAEKKYTYEDEAGKVARMRALLAHMKGKVIQ